MLFDFRGSRNKLAQSTILDLITFGLGYGFFGGETQGEVGGTQRWSC